MYVNKSRGRGNAYLRLGRLPRCGSGRASVQNGRRLAVEEWVSVNDIEWREGKVRTIEYAAIARAHAVTECSNLAFLEGGIGQGA
jgi:hypothetical protein